MALVELEYLQQVKVISYFFTGNSLELFSAAHDLLKESASPGIAYLAIGLYYQLTEGKGEDSRRAFLYVPPSGPHVGRGGLIRRVNTL